MGVAAAPPARRARARMLLLLPRSSRMGTYMGPHTCHVMTCMSCGQRESRRKYRLIHWSLPSRIMHSLRRFQHVSSSFRIAPNQQHHVVRSNPASLIQARRQLLQQQWQYCKTSRRHKSTSNHVEEEVPSSVSEGIAPMPTPQQLKNVFLRGAIPMMGFSFTDLTVMLHAGNAIDCTLGVTLGLSTLTAAAMGQFFSNSSGVLFGGALKRLASACGIPSTGLSAAQRSLPIVKRLNLMGALAGVWLGCTLGLCNLFIIDTERSPILKLRAFSEDNEFSYHIEASNADRNDATVLTIRGPNIDGVLASLTSTLAASGFSLVELIAKQTDDDCIEDIFLITKHGVRVPDNELDSLATALLDATRSPLNVYVFKERVQTLEEENMELRSRVQKLEGVVRTRQVDIVRSK